MPMADSREPNDGQPRPSWMERLVAVVKRGRSRDVIAGTVGENARGVVIGKNVIQIGTLRVSVLPAVALLLVLVTAVGGVAWWKVVPDKMPSGPEGTVNVAIAEFGERRPDGSVRSSEVGAALSEVVYTDLLNKVEDKVEDESIADITIWHDNMGLLAKRIQIGRIDSEEAAKKASATIGAHLVVYGYVEGESPYMFTPSFYAPSLEGGRELTGGAYFGRPLPIYRDPRLHSDDLSRDVDILTWFVLGLSHEIEGNFGRALDVFEQALAQFQKARKEHPREWDPQESQAVEAILYYFVGREAANYGEQALALDALDTAIELDASYARPYIARGYLRLAELEELPLEERATAQALQQAVADFQVGQQLAAGSPADHVTLKALLGLSTAYLQEADSCYAAGDYAGAGQRYSDAIGVVYQALAEESEAQLDPELYALAHYDLGGAWYGYAYLACGLGNLGAAADSYFKAQWAYGECASALGEGSQVMGQLPSAFTVTLLGDCQEQEECTASCIEQLAGGQDACFSMECRTHCQ